MTLTYSCGANNSTIPPVEIIETSPVIAQIKIRRSSSGIAWKNSYTSSIKEMFSQPVLDELFSADINQNDLNLIGCPSFNSLNIEEKKLFYIAFIASIAEAESDYEVAQKTYNKVDGTMNIGLLQIDEASADRHAKRIFNRDFTSEDLKNPDLNLKVGTVILKHQITNARTLNRLLPPTPYYWEVLGINKRRFLKNIRMNLSLLKNCRETNL